MSDDLIKRSDAIKAVWGEDINPSEDGMVFEAQSHIDRDIKLIPSADRPQKVIAQITFDEEKLREIVKEAVERFKEEYEITDRPQGEWIPCSERLPETDNTNEINEFDVLLVVRPKKHPERTPQVYIGKLRPVEGDNGSGNFWGVKTAPCEWTIWGWSYFQEPEVLAWMPLPKPWKGADDE